MEAIAEMEHMTLVYVSQVVNRLGLGDERYRGQYIPADGSRTVVVHANPTRRSRRLAENGGKK